MKRAFLVIAAVAVVGAVLVGDAMAAAPTMPTLPISTYGDTLLSSLTNVLGQIWPYAAIFTGVGIAVSAVKHWFGRRSATAAAK